MDWLAGFLARYPELVVFLAIALGYVIGGIKFGGFSFGPVTGSLVAGLAIGQFAEVPVSGLAKSFLYLRHRLLGRPAVPAASRGARGIADHDGGDGGGTDPGREYGRGPGLHAGLSGRTDTAHGVGERHRGVDGLDQTRRAPPATGEGKCRCLRLVSSASAGTRALPMKLL